MKKAWQTFEIILDFDQNIDMESISYCLFELGAMGVEIESDHDYMKHDLTPFGEIRDKKLNTPSSQITKIIAYYDYEMSEDIILGEIKKYYNIDKEILINTFITEDENWQQNWMKYYEIEKLSRYITICPSWKEYSGDNFEKIIKINPGLAFGTGNHSTTQLSAQALEIVMRGGEVVYDIGTGSGILSFIAGALGASSVNGFDLDSQAIEAANQNLLLQTDSELKQLIDDHKINFKINDLLKNQDEKADIIVANILPNILVNMFQDAENLIKENGFLILGGILKSKSEFIKEEMSKYNFKLYEYLESEQWTSFIYQKLGD